MIMQERIKIQFKFYFFTLMKEHNQQSIRHCKKHRQYHAGYCQEEGMWHKNILNFMLLHCFFSVQTNMFIQRCHTEIRLRNNANDTISGSIKIQAIISDYRNF